MKIIIIILSTVGILFLILVFLANKRRPKFNKKGYTLLEKNLLTEFYKLFDNKTQNILKTQIQYFENKRKWRQYWKKSMSIELYGDNENPLTENEKYQRKDESKLATIEFIVNNVKYSVEYNNYDGRIWGWKIRPNPKKIKNVSELEIISTKINNDPNTFAQISIKKEKFKKIPEFENKLKEITETKEIISAYKPLNSKLLKTLSNTINSKLPTEYVNIIKQTEGLEFNDFKILGISEIQRTNLDDGNYYHLVEFDDGVIAVKEEENNGTIYFCHFSDQIDNLGTNFIKILRERI